MVSLWMHCSHSSCQQHTVIVAEVPKLKMAVSLCAERELL